MIKHIVMWRLKDFANGNDKTTNARRVKETLETLGGTIPGMHKLEVGIDISATDRSADIVLYSEFESREALDNYQNHPEHKVIMPVVGELRSERWVVDYEV